MKQTLTEYTAGINRILKAAADKINKNKNNLFKAGHIPIVESMAKFYYDSDFSVEDAADEINSEVGY